jgi:hypothetical protein
MNVVLIAHYAHLQGKILNDIGKICRLNLAPAAPAAR